MQAYNNDFIQILNALGLNWLKCLKRIDVAVVVRWQRHKLALYASDQKVYCSNYFVSKRTYFVDWGRKNPYWYTSHLVGKNHEVPFIDMNDGT